MKRIVSVLIIASVGVAANAQLIDDFTSPATDYTIPSMPDYGPNLSTIPGPVFGIRDMAASNYAGSPYGSFTVSAPGTGTLSASGTGWASGQVDLSYFNQGFIGADLSADNAISVTVTGVKGPVDVAWGFFSGSFSESSASAVISGTGTTLLNFSDLGGAPLDSNNIQALFFEMNVPTCGNLSISQISAVPTPEPAPFAAMGLGVGFLALRRRKKQR